MNLMDLFIKIGVKDEASGPISKLSKSVGKGLATAAKIGTAAIGAAGTAIGALVTQSVRAYGEYEQLVGGAQKIFDQMDYSTIAADAAGAWETMNLSASEYLSMMNNVGATFAATMGDQRGYETAKRGMQAIADYASGTGKNVGELNDKFALITRSSQSYQSIADQFSGILPATSKDFLAQAQAAGILSDSYQQLTEVPIDEYQEAVSLMLEQGVAGLNLTNNTLNETKRTLTGSLAGMKAAWKNFMTGLSDSDADISKLMDTLVESAESFLENLEPVVMQALESLGGVVERLGPIIGEKLPGILMTVLPSLIRGAMGLIGALAESIPDMLSQIFSAVDGAISESGFADTWNAIKETVAANVALIKENWDRLVVALQPLIDRVQTAWQGFVKWAKESGILQDAIDAIGTTINVVIAVIGGIATAFEATLQAAEKAADWIKEKWQPVADFFSGIAATIESIFAKGPGVTSDTMNEFDWTGLNFAIGNDYVPYNGMPAILHRGEAVLTAREAEDWRQGNNGRGVQMVNNFYGVSQSDLDYIVAYVNRGLA